MSVLRPIAATDHEQVLAWNADHVELLSPLDGQRLTTLLGWADRGCVVVHEGVDVGFVLTFASRTAYDSENYRWFAQHFDDFYYLDRVVVDPSVRRSGIGTRVYDELERRARAVAPVMCLEVNLDPPNEPSLEFHRRRGYEEVGQGMAGDHLVSLLAKPLQGPL